MTDIKPRDEGLPPRGRPVRLADAVSSALLDDVIRGKVRPAGVLASESVLGQRFGVSRTVIREAVKTLEAQRIVVARQGLGTVVRDRGDWNLLDSQVLARSLDFEHGLELQGELAQLRMWLEGELSFQAAQRISASELMGIDGLLGELNSLLTRPATYLALDLEFHRAILRVSGNRLAEQIVDHVHQQIRSLLEQLDAPPSELARTHAEHVAIVEALHNRDPEATRTAMVDHIGHAWDRRRLQFQVRSAGATGRRGRRASPA